MRILVISDIHANLTALESVLESAGNVDAVWCLGDLVGYGPDPNECIERVQSLPNLTCLLGNHDAAALGMIDIYTFNHDAQLSAQWTQAVLNHANHDFLSNLKEQAVIGNATLAHGSPRNPIWEYIMDTYTAASNFEAFNTQICLVGHSHVPLQFHLNSDSIHFEVLTDLSNVKIRDRMIFNPGSVGQPRDHDPRASYAILDNELNTWNIYRVSYDIESVQKRIQKFNLPARHALRLSYGW